MAWHALKLPKWEVFIILDYRCFDTTKSLWVGEFGAKIKSTKFLIVGPENSYYIGETLC
jgi:hypothetical protein